MWVENLAALEMRVRHRGCQTRAAALGIGVASLSMGWREVLVRCGGHRKSPDERHNAATPRACASGHLTHLRAAFTVHACSTEKVKGGDPMSSDMCSVSTDFGSVSEVLG